MAVEIGTLVLKGRFGPARDDPSGPREDLEEVLEALRQDLLREMDEKLDEAERRAWER
jgi:hypothetical protein